jgi:hypothetical protein
MPNPRDSEKWPYKRGRIVDRNGKHFFNDDGSSNFLSDLPTFFLYRSAVVQGAEVLDFTSRDAVVTAIKAQYSELQDLWTEFTDIPGNHDTQRNNQYLEAKFSGGPHFSNETEGPSDQDARLNDTVMTRRLGKTQQGFDKPCIVIEHGHAFDSFNNDEDFYKDGKGYDTTVFYVGCEFGESLVDWLVVRVGGVFSNVVLIQYTGERMQKIFRENPDVRLVVLGHSHAPRLFAYYQFTR